MTERIEQPLDVLDQRLALVAGRRRGLVVGRRARRRAIRREDDGVQREPGDLDDPRQVATYPEPREHLVEDVSVGVVEALAQESRQQVVHQIHAGVVVVAQLGPA